MPTEPIRMDAIPSPSDDTVRCGVDVVSIGRIAGLLTEFDDSFRDRVFTPAEQRYCEGRGDPPQHYAARWAVTEAFLKAVGGTQRVPSDGIGVEHEGDVPALALSPPARAAAAAALGTTEARVGTAVSLSHDRTADCAAGQVVVFDRDRGETHGRGRQE